MGVVVVVVGGSNGDGGCTHAEQHLYIHTHIPTHIHTHPVCRSNCSGPAMESAAMPKGRAPTQQRNNEMQR
jgi:hypothetical protein